MYSIFVRNMTVANSEELCIYSDETVEDKFKLETATLQLQEGNAGSLTLKMPPINVGYNEIETLATQVIVRKDGAVYWFGRVVEVRIDYNNSKEIVIEGAYNYLMDTIQTPYHASTSISLWINHLITEHNSIVTAANEPWKQMVVGYIDPNINPSTYPDLYTNYETTLDMINNVCQGWEAHPLFSYQVDSTSKFPRLVLNFYKSYYTNPEGIPEIAFGENLSDYAKEIKNEDVATVVIPVGKEYSDDEKTVLQKQWTDYPNDPTQWTEPKPSTDISDLDWRHTIYSVNNQSIYLYDTQANLNRYGYNCKIVEFNETIDYTDLKAAGEKYLRDQKWDKLTLTLSGYDLSLLDYNLSPIKMGGLVHCLSKPHGLDYNYPCTAIEENFLDVTETKYTLGTANNSYLSDSSRQTDQKLRDAVSQAVVREKAIQQNSYAYTDGTATELYTELEAEIAAISFDPSEAVEEAKTNALQLLNIYDEEKNPSKKGYVHFIKETADYDAGSYLAFSELKAKINSKVTPTSNLTTFMARLDECMTQSVNNRAMIYVIVKVNNGVEDWNYFKVQLIHNYAWDDPGWYVNLGYYLQSDGSLGDYYSTTSNRDYNTGCSREYGLLQIAGTVSAVNLSSTNYVQTSGTINNASYINSTNGVYHVFPNKATLDDTTVNHYVSVPIDAGLRSATKYINPNIIDYVTNPQDHITEIVISDDKDYMSGTANVWRWNKDGLYYLNGGYYGGHSDATLDPSTQGYGTNTDNLRMALTKDGYIVADRVAVGQLDAGIVRTGVMMGNPAIPGDPTGDADFKMNLNNGTILAKKARLIFSNVREHGGTYGDPDQPLTEFAYFSNEPINRYTAVAGNVSKDWMLILGSSFGVDKYGRAYFREGYIGADGGYFDIFVYNDYPVRITYNTTPISGGYEYVWKYVVTFASDAFRPAKPGGNLSNYYYRMGYYEGSTLTFLTGIKTFEFDIGSDPVEMFYNFGTTTGTTQEPEEWPFYEGELFPVWYIPDENGEYEEEGVRYTQKTLADSNYRLEITGYLTDTTDYPQYKSWTDERKSVTGGSNQGRINITPGCLSNGSFGQTQSFWLSGFDKNGTVAGATAANWRLAVGSNFGVTSDGNMHANGAVLHYANVSGTISANFANIGGIPNIGLWAKARLDGPSQLITFAWKVANIGHLTQEGDTGIFTTKTAVLLNCISGLEYLNYNPRFSFSPAAEMKDNWGNDVPADEKGSFDLVFDRTGTNVQYYIIDTSSWNVPPQGAPYVCTGDIDMGVVFANENSQVMILQNQRQIKRNPTEGGASDTAYYCTGEIVLNRTDTGVSKNAVSIGAEYLIGDKLGGPNNKWNELHVASSSSTVSSSGDSSKHYKNSIEGLDPRYDKLFDILRPVRFKFNKNHYDDGGLYHAGFILEELGENLKIAGIKPEEFAAYDPNPDGEGGGIRYSEFIPLIVDQLQKLKRENEELKRQLYEKGILDD